MNDIITGEVMVDSLDFLDPRKYRKCFTQDNEPVYVPIGAGGKSGENTPYRDKKGAMPIWRKSNLTLEEAAVYSGIGIHRLRTLTEDDDCDFVIWVGSKRLIKREKFDAYIAGAYSI